MLADKTILQQFGAEAESISKLVNQRYTLGTIAPSNIVDLVKQVSGGNVLRPLKEIMEDQNISNEQKNGIEKAYEAGIVHWKKPISCHLYPIRITKYPEFDVLHYDRWHICSSACSFGKELKVPVYSFLKEPLIRLYGEAWYQELEKKVHSVQ